MATFREFSRLAKKRGWTANDGNERRVIHILCEPFEANILLEVAKEVWPDAALEIKSSIH